MTLAATFLECYKINLFSYVVFQKNGMLRHSFDKEVIFFLCSTLLILPGISCPACKLEVPEIAKRALFSRRERSIVALKRKISSPMLMCVIFGLKYLFWAYGDGEPVRGE